MPTISTLLATILDSGRYSDLTIKCGNKVFKVHRNIVCLQSKPLAAHVDGAFVEAITNEINLPDDHPAIFGRIIKFFYTGDFDATPSADEIAEEEASRKSAKETVYEAIDGPLEILTICTCVFVMAEKYDIPALKKLAKTKFKAAVSTEWNTVALSISLRLIYDELPDSDRLLKDVAIQAAASHIKELADRGEFAALCKENGDIAFDVLKAYLTVSKDSAQIVVRMMQHSIKEQEDIIAIDVVVTFSN
ncbi:BTB POZ domain protein [Rutstroemia sp. NJR-2017a BBW]|nr:BTB POZ domain protein [Rutstroemia sp. NJR-2017a BBW]